MSPTGIRGGFSNSMAPEGSSSFYVEIAHHPGKGPTDTDGLARSVEKAFKDLGIIPDRSRIVARLCLSIPCAYVFFDRFRGDNLEGILAALKERSIHSIGRYGAWEYSSMEDAVEWGLGTAGEVLS